MKKIINLVIIVILCIGVFIGCGEKETTKTTNGNIITENEEHYVTEENIRTSTQSNEYKDIIVSEYVGTWYSNDGTEQEIQILYNELTDVIEVTVKIFTSGVLRNTWYYEGSYSPEYLGEIICYKGTCNRIIDGKEVTIATECESKVFKEGLHLIWRVESNGSIIDFDFTNQPLEHPEYTVTNDLEYIVEPYQMSGVYYNNDGKVGEMKIDMYDSPEGEYVGEVFISYVSLTAFEDFGGPPYGGKIKKLDDNIYVIDSNTGEEFILKVSTDSTDIEIIIYYNGMEWTSCYLQDYGMYKNREHVVSEKIAGKYVALINNTEATLDIYSTMESEYIGKIDIYGDISLSGELVQVDNNLYRIINETDQEILIGVISENQNVWIDLFIDGSQIQSFILNEPYFEW